MLKSCLWRLLASVFGVVCVSTAFAVDDKPVPSVTVSVSPGAQTVNVRPNGVAETVYNTAKYAITGSFDENSITNDEVKPVNAVWTCSASAKFIPPEGVTPVPQNPGNPQITLTGGNCTWNAKITSQHAGQWEITFTVTVTYDVYDKKTEKVRVKDDGTNEKFGPYTGSGKCMFKATTVDFKIKLVSSDDFPGHAELTFGLGEYGEIQAWSMDGQTRYTVVDSNSTPTDIITVSGNIF